MTIGFRTRAPLAMRRRCRGGGLMRRDTLSAIAIMVLLSARLVGAQACPGDCDGDGDVSINELIIGVNIALGAQPVTACAAMDSNADGTVTVNELIRAVSMALNGCPAPTVTPTPAATATKTATSTALPATETPAATPRARLCDLPGSIQMTDNGVVVVPGGLGSAPDFRFMQLPVGFCAHYFANVGNTRQLRFAPGGELFVASPTTPTTGGGHGGRAAIVGSRRRRPRRLRRRTPSRSSAALAGFVDAGADVHQRLPLLPERHQDHARAVCAGRSRTVRSERAGGRHHVLLFDRCIGRRRSTPPTTAPSTSPTAATRARRAIRRGRSTAAFASSTARPTARRSPRGSATRSRCAAARPQPLLRRRARARTTPPPTAGARNWCAIRQGDDWGFPCCATKDVPYVDILPVPDCSGVAADNDSFIIGDTPFDVDFETGKWPAPWNHRAYLPLHGVAGAWEGARVVAIAMDPVNRRAGRRLHAAGRPSGVGSRFRRRLGRRHARRTAGRPTSRSRPTAGCSSATTTPATSSGSRHSIWSLRRRLEPVRRRRVTPSAGCQQKLPPEGAAFVKLDARDSLSCTSLHSVLGDAQNPALARGLLIPGARGANR